jgi:hypothetical protein
MKVAACRDCGALVAVDARGCPRCARNLVAERMLAKYFWLVGVPALIVLLGLCIFLLVR